MVDQVLGKHMIRIDRDVASFTDADACKAIARETRKIMDFWQYDSKGWAPTDVSEILENQSLKIPFEFYFR